MKTTQTKDLTAVALVCAVLGRRKVRSDISRFSISYSSRAPTPEKWASSAILRAF